MAASMLVVTGAIASTAGGCGEDRESSNDDGIAATAETAASATSAITSATTCTASAADGPVAEAMARTCGSRVEIESARDEYSTTYVEASGHRTLSVGIAPQRARALDGQWAAINTELQEIGGQIAPTAIAANVRFSNGGSGPFATMTTDGHTFSLSWPAPLPRPTLSGNSATYAEVLPGVDLVVKATDSGFAHLLVVKTAQAAANPAVRNARYKLGGDAKLTMTPDGGLLAAVGGVPVASAPAAMMWDATSNGASSEAVRDATALVATSSLRVAQVASSISARDLVLSPAASLLDDPTTVYPVTIDPPWNKGVIAWSYASADDQNGVTDGGTQGPGDPNPQGIVLRVGDDPTSSHRYRTFLRFPIGGLVGNQVLTAALHGQTDHTFDCGAQPNFFYRSNPLSNAGGRQNWPGPSLIQSLGSISVHANEAGGCGALQENASFELTNPTLVADLQLAANSGFADYYVAITAGANGNSNDPNESSNHRYMRHFASKFLLDTTFNRGPAKPDPTTVDGKACVTGANRPFVATATPRLVAHVTDPDNDTLNVTFVWSKWNGSTWVGAGTGSQNGIVNDGAAIFDVPSTVEGGIYVFTVQSADPSGAVSPVGGGCEWEVDTTKPAVPTVSADIYKEQSVGCLGGPCGSVGQTGRFIVSSSPDTQTFKWGFSGATQVLPPTTIGGSIVIDYTPESGGLKTLTVQAFDRAGNMSERTYQFMVAPESTALSRWLLSDAIGTTTLGDDTGNGRTLTLAAGTLGASGRIVESPDGIPRSALQVNGSGDGATAEPILADTSKSFSVAAWVKLADNTAVRHAVSQGGDNPAFALEYESSSNVWKLTAPSADGAFPGVVSTSPPRLNTWTHLVGTYDSAAHTMKLYVNGALENTATAITVRSVAGPVRIGHVWKGALAEIQLWNRVISAGEVFSLSDPIEVGDVGNWNMEPGPPGTSYDSSGMFRDLTLFNGASLPSGAGHVGAALRLDGVDDYAATAGQAIHTDQSYTISVWTRPAVTNVYQTFVSQEGGPEAHGGFALYYGADEALWKFRIYSSPTDGSQPSFAATPAVDVITAYHHLVAVFDAQKREMRLYVDNVLKSANPMNAAWQPWDSPGRLVIGKFPGGGTAPHNGDLDDVHIFQGVVANVRNIP